MSMSGLENDSIRPRQDMTAWGDIDHRRGTTDFDYKLIPPNTETLHWDHVSSARFSDLLQMSDDAAVDLFGGYNNSGGSGVALSCHQPSYCPPFYEHNSYYTLSEDQASCQFGFSNFPR